MFRRFSLCSSRRVLAKTPLPCARPAACFATLSETPDIAKHLDRPTVAKIPESFEYLLQQSFMQMTPEQIELMEEGAKREMAVMMGSPDEANFLSWLCELINAKLVLEVGVFRGSTSLAIAKALPADGKVVGLDLNADYIEIGRKFWQKAGVEQKIDYRVGPAAETMDKLLAGAEEGGEGMAGQFDLCFIDADKVSYDYYYERALKLVRKGGIIALDNTLLFGRFLTPEHRDAEDSVVMKALNEKLASDERVAITMLGIADGLTLCRVK